MSPDPEQCAAWNDALLAAALFALDPSGSGGVALRAGAGPVRDLWLERLRELLPEATPWRRIPPQVADDRLLGGLDLAATLAAGRPVADRGLLAEAHGGVVLLPMAERLASGTAARLTAALDSGTVALERDGLNRRSAACFGLVALDEGAADDERAPGALLDRLAFHLDLSGVSLGATRQTPAPPPLPAHDGDSGAVELPEALLESLVQAALQLGVDSPRAVLLALRVTRLTAALSGRRRAEAEDAAVAGRLVLGPRATRLPEQAPAPEQPQPEPEEPGEPSPAQQADDDRESAGGTLAETVVSAARAAMPEGLLQQLLPGVAAAARRASVGRAGAMGRSRLRGRPAGARPGRPVAGARLNLVETLRAAAPWQALRRRDGPPGAGDRIQVRAGDFRVTRYRQRTETTTIFAVDASGSTALHRLGEVKGAVELLLSDCYVRRDRVALVSFRGSGAELLLPPTRSLVLARRRLAALPGGGGTPLAAGIETALELSLEVLRRGGTPLVLLLTDGRANIDRNGRPGREAAAEDARGASRRLAEAGVRTLLVDTSPRPQPRARELAEALQAGYLALPRADAAALNQAVRELGTAGPAR